LCSAERWTLRSRSEIKSFECGVGEGRRRLVGPICEEGRSTCGVKMEGNILRTIQRRKTNWTGHILHRNWLPKDVIEGNIDGIILVTGRQ